MLSSLLPLLSFSLLLIACSGGDRPAPPPERPTAGEVLARSSKAMADVTSFKFTLESQGGNTPIPAGLEMSGADGVMAQPDRLDVKVKARFAGFVVEVRVISVGEQTFMTNPLTGAWQRFDSALSPVAFFDPAKGVGLVLDSFTAPELLQDAPIDGAASYHARGRLPGSAVRFIAGSSIEGSVLDAEVWIGKQDLLLRRIRLEGRLTPTEVPGIVRVLSFADFNKPQNIQAPV